MPLETLAKLSGRVLVVDDSAHGRSIVSRILQCVGLQTEQAEHGGEACAKATRAAEAGEPFDLILMDMHMPTMDGFVATATLRRHGYTGRIAALTAYATSTSRRECLDAGCDDYAEKPITFEDLRDLVQRHLPAAAATPPRRTQARRPVRTRQVAACA